MPQNPQIPRQDNKWEIIDENEWEEVPIEQPKGFLKNAWDALFENPLTTFPSRAAKSISEWIDPDDPIKGRSTGGLRGVSSAFIESLGNVGDIATAPGNLGLAFTSLGSSLAARQGLGQIARGLSGAEKVLSVPVLGHGLETITDPEASWGDRAIGALETLGGAAGLAHRPQIRSRNKPPLNYPRVTVLPPESPRQLTGRVLEDIDAPFSPNTGVPPGIDDIDSLINELNAVDPDFTVVDPDSGLINNASGDSSASIEAMNRDRGMRDRGQQFMVYDRTGQPRPLIGVDAVDYAVRPGETYGIMNADGNFQVLDDQGGNYPRVQSNQPRTNQFASQVLDESSPINVNESFDLLNTPIEQTPEIPSPEISRGIRRGGRLDEINQPSALQEIKNAMMGRWDEPVDNSLEAFVNQVRQSDKDILNFNLERTADTLPREGDLPDRRSISFEAESDIEPRFSLKDRPVSIRTNEELEQRIAHLESKPNLNEGGRRALGEMRNELTLRKLQEQEEFEGTRDVNDDEPLFARTESGKAQIGVNVARSAKELTSGYSSPLAGIMVREGLQNAIDATSHLGTNGKISINLDRDTNLEDNLVISDNGKGMSPEELFTVYTNLHESGKTDKSGAIGGKGVGKAPYMLGGKHFQVTTVKEINGQKIESSFGGTPDELMQPFDIQTKVVSYNTPTGTSFTTKLGKKQYPFQIEEMTNKIERYTRGVKSQLQIGKYNKKLTTSFDDFSGDRLIEQRIIQNNDVEIYLPNNYDTIMDNTIPVIYLNNGMYQFTDRIYLGSEVNGIPSEIMVNIKPLVEEGSKDYPFPVQRESVKEEIKKQIDDAIISGIINPVKHKRKIDLVKLWDSMETTKSSLTGKDLVFFDPGNKLSPDEYMEFYNNPIVSSLLNIIDGTIHSILQNSGHKNWLKKVKRIGITLDSNLHGIHIPDPRSNGESSAILINPFLYATKENAALDTVVTMIHEVAHVGTIDDVILRPKLSIDELEDPRVGRFLSTYLKEVHDHGGLDLGHGIPFIQRLGELYATFGVRRSLQAADRIQEIIIDETGSYRPEFQKLLRLYEESRGRKATSEDILSPTGIKSEASRGRKNINGRNNRTDGTRTPRAYREGDSVIIENINPEYARLIMEKGFVFKAIRDDGTLEFVPGPPSKGPILESETNRSNARPTPKNAASGGFPPGQGPPPPRRGSGGPKDGPSGDVPTEQKRRWFTEAWNLPRSLMASVDFSAPLRQGFTLIHKKAFWTSLDDMVRSWSSKEFFDATMNSIKERPLFKARLQPNEKYAKSFAEEAGLRFTDLKSLDTREEAIISSWAEKIPVIGRAVRASNRAYTGFLNKLRADTYETLIKINKVFGADGTVNLPLARALAEYVNNATGRGSLGIFEQSAVTLNNMIFSPRLIASRLSFLNPKTYWTAPPQVRKEYIKSLFAVALVGNTVTQLGKLGGGEVNTNPNSSDYGKLKIGNIRLDPYGGFQQYIVAANRLLRPGFAEIPSMKDISGGPLNVALPIDMTGGWLGQGGQQMTSSTSDREYDLWNQNGPFDPTWMDIALRFFRGKAHPALGFAISIAMGAREMDGKPMDFTAMNPMDNAIMQRFIPIFLQDLYEVSQENPALVPILAPLSGLGMSIQTYSDRDRR